MIYYRKTLFGSGPKLTAVQGQINIPNWAHEMLDEQPQETK
jgi:hypothetical protein